MSEIDDDNQRCEFCPEVHPIEDMRSAGDGWFCPACVKTANEAFAACSHTWRPVDHQGDAAQYCERCCHMVRDEDFPAVFGLPSPPSDQTGEGP